MKKKNCWEVKKCGREPGGKNAGELGVCPAAKKCKYDGTNSGKHGGRCCWFVAGTLCGGKPQGTFAKKVLNCLQCEFFKQVVKEEERDIVRLPPDSVDDEENEDENDPTENDKPEDQKEYRTFP